MKRIQQAVTTECLFRVLEQWCRAGAAFRDRTLRILSAFVTGGAVEATEPLMDVFLAQGNRIEIILGIDLGGTDTQALRRLHALQEAYHQQVDVRVWDVPLRGSIFHPKLYLLDSPTRLSAVVGSANFTLGGLGGNLESLWCFDGIPRNSADARELLSVWNMFARPTQPLRPEFIKPLS